MPNQHRRVIARRGHPLLNIPRITISAGDHAAYRYENISIKSHSPKVYFFSVKMVK
ncbi:hypothetical protein OZL92_05905 [Bacillus sonorensis]|uniref:Uncharacterized protein n=1 Tax=Bacillus sonorensis TaxID=119858 RepID=A0ABM6LPZ2_9BACI|nr:MULTISPECIES: hypothetical protein [Bacillus]TWK83664.1 hypothetical protein CHCC20335_4735 [Bacillus paralicheniformis]ASB91523.1 hypothetical protein S101395_05044 [Bacillus sonorensis]MCF7615875.1 hypothetical protein [Bacillus sonorensis]MCY7858202.1 hypothetical protein [Bacillus sonorensis]MCY8024105.1 hypothetical protein [Bacillus sonorensis]